MSQPGEREEYKKRKNEVVFTIFCECNCQTSTSKFGTTRERGQLKQKFLSIKLAGNPAHAYVNVQKGKVDSVVSRTEAFFLSRVRTSWLVWLSPLACSPSYGGTFIYRAPLIYAFAHSSLWPIQISTGIWPERTQRGRRKPEARNWEARDWPRSKAQAGVKIFEVANDL